MHGSFLVLLDLRVDGAQTAGRISNRPGPPTTRTRKGAAMEKAIAAKFLMENPDPMTRREVAAMLGMHVDSVTRNLQDGLASAVLKWGGHGKRMTFSRLMVLRWWRAKTCTKDGGRYCTICYWVLDDCLAVGEHLIEARHGVFEGCDEDCGYPGGIGQPCA